MPKAEAATEEAPEELPLPLLLLLLDDPEPEVVALERGAELEPRAEVAMELEAEAEEDEVGAADDEGTIDLMPFEIEAVVLQFEVLGVE